MSDLDALKGQVKAKSEQGDAESWKPKTAGDELAGYVRKIEYLFTQYGEGYRLLVETEDGKSLHLWCTGAVLSGQLLDVTPALDSPIVVLYEGKRKNKAGTFEYDGYQMVGTTPDFEPYKVARAEAYEKKAIKEQEAIEEHRARNAVAADSLESPF